MIKVNKTVSLEDRMNDPRVLEILGQCYEEMAYLYDPEDIGLLRPVWSEAMENILPSLGIEMSASWGSLSDEIKDETMEQACPILGFDAVVQLVEHIHRLLPIPDQMSSIRH